MVLAHLSILLNIARGIGAESCGVDNVFPPNDLGIGVDTECSLSDLMNVNSN